MKKVKLQQEMKIVLKQVKTVCAIWEIMMIYYTCQQTPFIYIPSMTDDF